jgi:hypothetical protein
MHKVTHRNRPPGFVTPARLTPEMRRTTGAAGVCHAVHVAVPAARDLRHVVGRGGPGACISWKTCRPRCHFPQSSGPTCSGWKISAAITDFPRLACSGPFHAADPGTGRRGSEDGVRPIAATLHGGLDVRRRCAAAAAVRRRPRPGSGPSTARTLPLTTTGNGTTARAPPTPRAIGGSGAFPSRRLSRNRRHV